MADQPRTQKQIALKYKDNLDYYRRGHFLRRLKLALFLLAVFGSLGVVFGFRFWGNNQFFNTGPISQNHARFANDCAACHDGVVTDLTRALKLDQAVTDLKEGHLPTGALTTLKAAGENFSAAEIAAAVQRKFSPDQFSALQKAVIKKSSLAGMDAACLKCHEPFKLHQPQVEALKLRGVHPVLPLVHSDRCSTCHREHVGHGLMNIPGSETCATCHADLKELTRTRNVIQVASPSPPERPENRDIGDSLIRFLMPQEANAPLAVIKNYAEGHPPFRYEGANARDPAVIQFNHVKHAQTDVVKSDGKMLACQDCHEPKDGGAYHERVKFAKHCASCHSLNVVSELPDFTIPHGDPTVVHVFVKTMHQQLTTHLHNKTPFAADDAIAQQGLKIMEGVIGRGITNQLNFKQRIFETGDPPPDGRVTPRSNSRQIFPPCAKCHEVTKSDGEVPYKITKTNIADRWVHHGPFTHEPHRHMSCNDCHAQAHTSKATSDILLPKQTLCAECHRPLQKDKVLEVIGDGVAPKPGTAAMAAMQRREGGVKWECQNCHQFHAPPEAIRMLEAAAAK